MKSHVLFVLALFSTVCGFAQKSTTMKFPADAAEILYSGRVSFSDPARPAYCHSGVSIQTIFTGTHLSMELIEHSEGGEKNTNYYTVVVDGKVSSILQTRPGRHVYELVSKLPKARHTIEVFKRTECSVGSVTFMGFVAEKGTVLEKPSTYSHRMEFIGDSFTCGYGNEASIAEPPEGNPNTGFHSRNEDHYRSYGAILSRLLQTEYRAVAYSGRGMYRNNSGNYEGTLPQIYERIFPDDEQSVWWDVRKEVPDLLVIKLGANDFFPESRGEDLDDKAFIETYVNFLEKLRGYYPKAKIICITGVSMSDSWPEGRNCLTRIQKDVKEVVSQRTAKGDPGVYYFKLDQQTAPYGEDWHASVATHQKMAEQLAPFVREVMNW